ncbi:MAG: hypothetical protein SPI61_06440 [Ezakiella sp.]|uniref:hypothetical protein n=1 Tax=Ezakiella sp. TaxID=1935205 RepID=UPI002A91D0A9|nr:hypothetical protein [Ezakiella sp.]MDY6080344.1 hypothetical protein [Ezakiella sp.]
MKKFSLNIDDLEISPPTSWKNQDDGTQIRTAREVYIKEKIDTKKFTIGTGIIDIDETSEAVEDVNSSIGHYNYETIISISIDVENKTEENLMLNLLESSLKINGKQYKPLIVIDGNYNSDKLDEKFNGKVTKNVFMLVDKLDMRPKEVETVEWNIDAPTDNDGNKVGKDIRITIPIR